MKKFLAILLVLIMVLSVMPGIFGADDVNPTLLSTHLDEINNAMEKAGKSDRYSLLNVPVTLYNYDGLAWNKFYDNKTNGDFFAFAGTVKNVVSKPSDISAGWTGSGVQANGGGSVALMGIVESELNEKGLPKMSAGYDVDLFSDDDINTTYQIGGKTTGPVKKVYKDVDFQFVYNETTGYYTYNAALNHAQLSNDEKTIQLYKQSLAPSNHVDQHGNAGFYPFQDITKAFKNEGYYDSSITDGSNEYGKRQINDWSWTYWAELLENKGYMLTKGEYAVGTMTSAQEGSDVELHYGIHVESDFYMPKGKQIDDKDMIYEFTGDDDLWVFIDGKLVLDIGGGHTAVSGSFNLTTGEVWVEKYTKLAKEDGGSYSNREQGTDLRYTDQFIVSLEDDQMHTIQIFYLERHAGVSNCRMRFNLPLVPSNTVYVSKNLEAEDRNELSVNPNVDYKFQILTAEDDNDLIDQILQPYAGKEYSVTENGKEKYVGRTDADGMFTLKEGQRAVFSYIPRFTEVTVIEYKPDDTYVYGVSKVKLNGSEKDYAYGEQAGTMIMPLDTIISFDFINIMKTDPLTIEKKVVGDANGLIDENQEFMFALDFSDILEIPETPIATTGAHESIYDGTSFALKQGESITIPYVPENMSFTLKELAVDDNFDAPKFNDVKSEFGIAVAYSVPVDNNKITVLNQQRFDLVISKAGISELDHDSEGILNETQSTIYRLTGNGIDMNVAIHGNGRVVIKDLPVSNDYKVEELIDWSWRYSNTDCKKTVDVDKKEVSISFTNTRQNGLWLSGDNHCENQFTVNTVEAVQE